MKAETYPLQVLLWALSGWVNREQQDVVAYLVEENRVLKEQMKGRRLRLTNNQRRRLAAQGKRLGRKTLKSRGDRAFPGCWRQLTTFPDEAPAPVKKAF